MAAEDFTGRLCGTWKVIKRDRHPKSKSHETFWLCECQRCGNIASVRKTNLKKEPKSCNNCKNKVYQFGGLPSYHIGDRYGLLTIIGKAPSKSNHTYVKCQCDCGNIIEVRLAHLKGQSHGRTISCGCATRSSGELRIRQVLEKAKISFAEQYRIKDFSMYAPFDFCVFNDDGSINRLIEFDGEQHYQPVEFFGGEEQFKKQQEVDKRKNLYCEEHGIKLLRVPYTDINKITVNYLLS